MLSYKPPRTLRALGRPLAWYIRTIHASSRACRPEPSSLVVHGVTYAKDDYTNIPSSIMSRVFPSPQLPYREHHPLKILREEIERIFGQKYSAIRAPSPVVTTKLNFDDLGFPANHPGRQN